MNRFIVISFDPETEQEEVITSRTHRGDAEFDVRLLYAVGKRAFVRDQQESQ